MADFHSDYIGVDQALKDSTQNNTSSLNLGLVSGQFLYIYFTQKYGGRKPSPGRKEPIPIKRYLQQTADIGYQSYGMYLDAKSFQQVQVQDIYIYVLATSVCFALH